MHLYVSLRAKRGVVISGGGELVMKAKAPAGRRIFRSVLPAVLVVGVVLPFLFIRAAFLALDGAGAGVCSSINCIGWRLGPGLFVGGDSSSRLANELTRALLETKEGGGVVNKAQRGRKEVGGVSEDRLPETFDELVAEAARKKLDVRSFVSKTKSLVFKMERKLQWAKKQRSAYRYLASIGVPNSIHCLCLRLAEEYSTNSHARVSLPPPEYASRLKDKSFLHVAIISDNVLATRVVVASAVKASSQPDKMVFHVITDKKTYAPLHAWFALNPVWPALVEVKSLHQCNWPPSINSRIIEMMGIHHALQEHYFNYDRSTSMMEERLDSWRLDSLRPSAISLLNHMRIYLPELFPELDKIVFLDDDVVVQQDLSPLWSLHLNGKVNGAVSSRMMIEGDKSGNCIGRVLGEYLNFSYPEIFSSGLKENDCAWTDGMNIFDLDAWRGTNISQTYHRWLKLNREANFALWRVGSLPPALIAFAGLVHPIDPSWHVSGLGEEVLEVNDDFLESAAVLHYSGPAKPWLPIAYPKLKRLWTVHINYSDEMMKSCGIIDY